MYKTHTKIILFFSVVFCFGFISSDHENFPVPSGYKNLVFYVQRSFNKNTLIYQLNFNDNNELNAKEPIVVHWINYTGKGEIESLNYIQRNYAYGLSIHEIDTAKKTFNFHFVSYKKQTFYLLKSSDQKYHVFSYFDKRLLLLNHIYVHIEGGSFWTPKVKYIEVYGKDPSKNEEIIQKIIP